MTPRDALLELQRRMNRSILGQEHVVERILLTLLCDGNLLLEGLPGLAKTRAIKSLARNVEADFGRVQFTPDLLPADVTGTEIYQDDEGHGRFVFQPGPVFSNLLLADEINRAPAKVQSALLEAMEERQVTVAGTTHALPPLFLVLATQNPIEQEGTYPLPEAQMDRFLMHVTMGHPDDETERAIIRLVREETGGDAGTPPPPVAQQAIFDARREIHSVAIAEPMESYLVALIAATRRPAAYGDDLARWIQVGASPRGSLALDRTARAHAWLAGRDHVTPDDLRAVAHDCLRHRLILSYEAHAEGISPDAVIDEILGLVAVV